MTFNKNSNSGSRSSSYGKRPSHGSYSSGEGGYRGGSSSGYRGRLWRSFLGGRIGGGYGTGQAADAAQEKASASTFPAS